MAAPADLPLLLVASQADWEDWLAQNHADSKGVWLQNAKKPETRCARIEKFIAMMEKGGKFYP